MTSKSFATLIVFSSICLSPASFAATWHVDEDVAVAGDGTSWVNAFTTVQDGLAAASSGDEIRVAEGTYFPDEGGVAVDGDRNATFQLITGVTLRGGYPNGGGARDVGSYPTILSGDIGQDDVTFPTGDNSYSVVTSSGVDSTALLSGFTITAGLADGLSADPFDGPTRAGAGLYAVGGSPTLRQCSFINNSAGFGGGLFGKTLSSPKLVNCLIAGNQAGFFGGGINNRVNSSPVLINCTITANSAGSNSGGGAITNFSSCFPSLTNCILWNNMENGNTTTVAASVNEAGSSTTSYNYSLVQNIAPGGTNLDGTSVSNDPDFLIPGDPSAAPSKDGNFRLETGSPALDLGDNTAGVGSEDVIGNPRIVNLVIDLGAYEGAFPPVLFPVLYVDHLVATPGTGGTWGTAFETLQDALQGAFSGQKILVAKGTYYPDEGGTAVNDDRDAVFRLVNGVTVEGGYPNGGGVRSLAANPTILSGDIDKNDTGSPSGGNSYTVVNGANRNATAVLDGFVIEAGLADEDVGDFDLPANSGGGVHNKDGSPKLLNCIIRGNFALSGGGSFNTGNSTPTFINCVVSGNKTTGFGGGFHNRSGAHVVFINTTFSGNSATNTGGAIINFTANPSLTNCIVWDNEAQGGTGTVAASVSDGGGSTTSYNYSLVESLAPGGTNFDGIRGGNNPLFLAPINPATAPTQAGDLRLTTGSFALDKGDGTANPETIDLLGAPRVGGAGIDLGSYEGAILAVDSDGDGLSDSFELAFTTPISNTALIPDSDEDLDDFTALEEFAYRLDPTVGNSSADAFSVEIIADGQSDYLSITWVANPAALSFVDIVAEQSDDLGITDAWSAADTVSIIAPAGMGGARSTNAISGQFKDFLRLGVSKK